MAHAAAKELEEELAWLEAQLQQRGKSGPLLGEGGALGLADAALLPWLLRMPLLEHFRGWRGFSAAKAALPALHAYVDAAKALPAVKATLEPPAGRAVSSEAEWIQHMQKIYLPYAGSPANYF